MRTSNPYGIRRKILAIALLAAFGTAYAEEDEATVALTQPSSSVTAGGGFASGDVRDRSLFGQYNGLRKDDATLILDLQFSKRDDASGTWFNVIGRDLGLTSRELKGQADRQGDWKVYGEYTELTRYYPRTVNTSLQGAGTTTPTVSLLAVPGTGSDLDLKTERKRVSIGGEKWFGKSMMLELQFTNEDKDGARLFGRGFTCASGAAPAPICTPLPTGVNQWALLMLPEPVDSTIRQFEAKFNYMGASLALTAGYYGTFYENHANNLTPTITGNLNNPLGHPMGQDNSVALTTGLRNILQLAMALPPDNEAHQFFVSGNYGFTPSTRATFKYAYTKATQKDDFAKRGFTDAPAGVSNYGGEVDTTLAQLGITSRPLPKLNVSAALRYEDRQDKSPLALYNIEGANRFTNGTYSLKKTQGKAEATYQLPSALRVIVGADYEKLDRGQLSSPECIDLGDGSCIGDSVAGISGLRAQTTEWSYRGELRRVMSDTFSGSIAWIHSKRDGSSWLKPASLPATGTIPVSNDAAFGRTAIYPSIFMDRRRDKARMQGDWSPTENTSVQLTYEFGKDSYAAPTTKGLDDTGMQLFGIDAAFVLAEGWKAHAYYTYAQQSLKVAHSTGYMADIKDRNNTAGFGVSGAASPKLSLALDVFATTDRTSYAQGLDSLASATNVAFLAQSGGLPDVTFRDIRTRFTANYAIDKKQGVRLDMVYDRQNLDEWTWGAAGGAPFLYSDNTTVGIQPRQGVMFVGLSYVYRWR